MATEIRGEQGPELVISTRHAALIEVCPTCGQAKDEVVVTAANGCEVARFRQCPDERH